MNNGFLEISNILIVLTGVQYTKNNRYCSAELCNGNHNGESLLKVIFYCIEKVRIN